MTALAIAMAGYLAFGQPTGDYYEAITKHAGLQVIHADGAVTLRLELVGTLAEVPNFRVPKQCRPLS